MLVQKYEEMKRRDRESSSPTERRYKDEPPKQEKFGPETRTGVTHDYVWVWLNMNGVTDMNQSKYIHEVKFIVSRLMNDEPYPC